jgi:hypothetical protein
VSKIANPTNMYFLPLRLAVLVGPMRSICNNSKFLEVKILEVFL